MKGNQRHEDFDYPDDEYRYFVLAERFGWTPSQVDNESAVLIDYMVAISNVVEEVKSEALED